MNRLKSWLPSRGNVLFTLVIAASLIFYVHSVGAFPSVNQPQAPNVASTGTIAYQGRLFSAGGVPLNSSYPMTFTLYSAPTGIPYLWREARPSVTVNDGLFNVLLGSNTPITPSIISSNSSLWLGVQVGTDPEMTPRVQLGSAPYAIQGWTVPDGAITTVKIADRAVTSQKAFLTTGQITPTADLILSTSPQILPSMRITLTPTTNQTYIFYLVTEFFDGTSATGYGQAWLSVDGNQAGGQVALMNWAAILGTVAQTYRVNLTAGSHVIEVWALSSDGGGVVAKWHTSLTWFAVSQ